MISINASLLTKFKQKLETIKATNPDILSTSNNVHQNQHDPFCNQSFSSVTEMQNAMTQKLKKKLKEYENKKWNIKNYVVIQSDDEPLTNPSQKHSLQKASAPEKQHQVRDQIMELNKNQDSTEIAFEKMGERKENEKISHDECETQKRQQKKVSMTQKPTQMEKCFTFEKRAVQQQQMTQIVCEELSQLRDQNCSNSLQARDKSKSSFKTMTFQQAARTVQPPSDCLGTIYPFMINNLLEVYPKIPSKVVKLYMQEIALKHKIHFNKLMVAFCIQAIIAKFYETHEIDCLVSGKYFFSELEQFLPTFMAQVNICQWPTILEVCQGLSTRFDIKNSFEEEWLITTIRKKKTFLRENEVNVEQILIASRTKQSLHVRMDSQEPTANDFNCYRYEGIEKYLQRENKAKKVQLEPPNYDNALEKSDKKGVSNQLRYYQQLKQKLQASKAAQKMSSKDNKHDVDSSLKPIEFDIIKYCSKFSHDVEILSQFQEHDEEKFSLLDREMGNKKEKMKQKEREKQAQRKKKAEALKKNENHHVSKSVRAAIEIDVEPSFIDSSQGTNSEKTKATSKQKQAVPSKSKLPIPSLKSQSKKQEAFDVEKELMKIDEIVFKYYEGSMSEQPSIAGISQTIKQFLKQNKTPEKYHDKLLQKWFAKYSD